MELDLLNVDASVTVLDCPSSSSMTSVVDESKNILQLRRGSQLTLRSLLLTIGDGIMAQLG